MRICIPTMDDNGLEGMPSDHFGSAPFFTFVDTDSGEAEAVRNGGDDRVHGTCAPVAFLGTQGVDAIVCRGLGRGALARFQAGGIQVFVSRGESVGKILDTIRGGALREMTPGEACRGHSHGGQGHGHGGHGQGTGQGRGMGGGGCRN